MPKVIEIRDLNAPELAPYVRLTEAQLQNRLKPESGLFIAESPNVIQSALNAGYTPVSFLMERRHITGKAADLLSHCGETPVYTAPRAQLETLTGFPLTRGVLCAMRRKALPTAEEICTGQRRVAVLENIVDTTNIGAIFRCAAAIGIGAVLLTPSCCDPLNRRAVRVSMGTVFNVPYARIGQEPADWPETGLRLLNALGLKTCALALTDKSVSIDDAALQREERLALILGTEGDGLTAQTVARCDITARIPMRNGVDSLNVAAAAAIAFWQLR